MELDTVVCGDCLDVMAGMEDGCMAGIIIDPPYCSGGYLEAQKNTKAQGLRGATVAKDDFQWFQNDNMGTSGLVWLVRSVLVHARRLLEPNRSVFVFTDWRMVPNLAPACESSGLRYRNMLVWDKGNGGLGQGFRPAYEIILEFTNGVTDYQVKDGCNVLRFSRVHASKRNHNAEKPLELITELIRVAIPERGTIFDGFMGSGTTAVAALKLGRHFYGCDISPDYVRLANERIEKARLEISQLELL